MENYPDEYSDEEEFQDNVTDEQREVFEESTGMNYPQARKPESLFSLFKDVWRTTDSSKVGNLSLDELGNLNMSVRDCQNIAMMAELFHHDKFAKFFSDKGEITLSTSASKKGWFTELFVTSKKFAHKGTTGQSGPLTKQKWRLFGQKEEPVQET